jgi:surfeit locus 1 family protein
MRSSCPTPTTVTGRPPASGYRAGVPSSPSTVRLALAPRWWAWHVLLVAALVAMGWLGWWQLRSFEDGGAEGARPQRVVGIDTVTSPGGRLRAGDPGRVVTARGSWEADRQLTVPDRDLAGRAGRWVVTPLRTGAGLLPVVRGWVPRRAPAPVPPPGEVTVRGVLQESESASDGSLTTVPSRRQVPYVATVTLLDVLPYDADELYDGYLALRSTAPGDPAAPRTVEASTDPGGHPGQVGRWRNLAYALQWWLFAAAAVFFWAAVLRRAVREQRAAAAAPGEADAALTAPRRTT